MMTLLRVYTDRGHVAMPGTTHQCNVIFVNENQNENGEKRKYNEFVNEN